MKRTSAVGLYILLVVFAAIGMAYYIAGAFALREEFFHASRYAHAPFYFQDDGQTLEGLSKEATAAGVGDGNVLVAVNGAALHGDRHRREAAITSRSRRSAALRALAAVSGLGATVASWRSRSITCLMLRTKSPPDTKGALRRPLLPWRSPPCSTWRSSRPLAQS